MGQLAPGTRHRESIRLEAKVWHYSTFEISDKPIDFRPVRYVPQHMVLVATESDGAKTPKAQKPYVALYLKEDGSVIESRKGGY